MSPKKERDPPLGPIPENTEAKPSANWNDEDAEDLEEQGLFERDNEEGGGDTPKDYPLNNDGEESNTNTQGDGGDSDTEPRIDPGPIYVQSAAGDSWELTWPIWHLLPRNERHAIAAQHGCKTIGEFEEYMTLARAVDESEVGIDVPRSGVAVLSNRDIAGVQDQVVEDLTTGIADLSVGTADKRTGDTAWQPPFIRDMEDDDISVSSSEEETDTKDGETPTDKASIDLQDHLEMIRLGGLPCSIPDEILHKCFAYLPVDDHATLALVSPFWHRFVKCESLYKTLCERVYLNQSKRKTLHISRFGNSYRRMLELRPRVRAGGGLYVLKYQEVRKIERDMWTEIPVGAVLESVYYRYLYFFEDGRVMYALTHAGPGEMIPRFSKMLIHGVSVKDKWGVWGRYQIRKDVVRVWVTQEWHEVCFQLKVIPSNKVLHYDMGDRGVCTTMKLEKHLSSISGNFDDFSHDLVDYKIPDQCYFRFLRDRRL